MEKTENAIRIFFKETFTVKIQGEIERQLFLHSGFWRFYLFGF